MEDPILNIERSSNPGGGFCLLTNVGNGSRPEFTLSCSTISIVSSDRK